MITPANEVPTKIIRAIRRFVSMTVALLQMPKAQPKSDSQWNIELNLWQAFNSSSFTLIGAH